MASHPARAPAPLRAHSRQRSAQSSVRVSSIVHGHGLADRVQRVARRSTRPFAPFRDDTAYQLGILLELYRPLRNAGYFFDDFFDQRPLAIQTADSGGAAALLHPGLRLGVRIHLVQGPHGTLAGVA